MPKTLKDALDRFSAISNLNVSKTDGSFARNFVEANEPGQMAMEKMTNGTTKSYSLLGTGNRVSPSSMIAHARAALFVQQVKANIVVFDGRIDRPEWRPDRRR